MVFNTPIVAFEWPTVFHAPAMFHVCSHRSFFATSYAIHGATEYESAGISILIRDNLK